MKVIVYDEEQELTPAMVAAVVAEWDSNKQAECINILADLMHTWDEPFGYQLAAISKRGLTKKAKRVVRNIRECFV